MKISEILLFRRHCRDAWNKYLEAPIVRKIKCTIYEVKQLHSLDGDNEKFNSFPIIARAKCDKHVNEMFQLLLFVKQDKSYKLIKNLQSDFDYHEFVLILNLLYEPKVRILGIQKNQKNNY